MSRTSKHERIIREELESAQVDLDTAEAELRKHQLTADVLSARINALKRVLARADADKTGGDDAES